ncbi:MAG: RNA-binding protein Rrp4-related protein [Candidatus Nanosalina sp. J07AB43]|nr:MAG: RNA-binding protein Rrp4-related protein [Candidatus Nanosalina sp. J07AB43]
MSRLKQENDIVVPGDVITEEDNVKPNSGVYTEEGKIYSQHIGTVKYGSGNVRVQPMDGRYIPEEGDVVIAEVTRVSYSRWNLDMDSPYEGTLDISEASDQYVDLDEDDLTDFYDVGDAVVAKVTSVSESMDVDLTMLDDRCRKLEEGRIINISPHKVPRVIGRQGTMVQQINEKTNCHVIVGQNGLVWINGENPTVAAEAVNKVEEEAHTDGLTDRIGEWIDEQLEQRGEN